MSNPQYEGYCDSLGILSAIQSVSGRTVQCMGGSLTAYGTLLVQIPLTPLVFLIDVEFLVIEDDVSTLVSLRGMLKTISICPSRKNVII